jgi:DNA-binding MarR family transcriptional regulator
MYTEKELKNIIIKEVGEDNEKQIVIDILKNGYNIIEQTIYNEQLAKKILELIESEEN